MKLRTYSDYALRVLMFAALRGPRRATIDQVADAFGISRNHLVKVVHALAKGGYLLSRRGVGGGFTLAKPAERILIGDVLRFTEAGERVVDCGDRANRRCRIFSACLLKGALANASAQFFRTLDCYSLKDLVGKPAGMRRLLSLNA